MGDKLKAFNKLTADFGKASAAFAVLFLLLVVGYKVSLNRSIQIGTFVVPEDLERRGYTSQTFGERLLYAIEGKYESARRPYASASRNRSPSEEFALGGDPGLPDIEVPKTGLSYHSLVLLLQEILSLQPPMLTGEVTEELNGFIATVSVSHSRRPASDACSKQTAAHPDPQSLVEDMADRSIELIDPYVLAVYSYRHHNIDATMHLISECDGKFAKWGWLLWGAVLLDQKDFEGAIDKDKRALLIDPQFAVAYYNWGLALDSRPEPDYEGAIEKYRTATDLDWNYAHAYHNWGVALLSKHDPDYEGAIEKYQVAIYLDPKLFDTYNNLGVALMSMPHPDFEGAVANYNKAIALAPGFSAAYCNMGYALFQKPHPDYDGAIQAFGRAIEMDPTASVAYSQLEEATKKDNHQKDSANELNEELKSQPSRWVLHYALALLEIEMGDRKLAIGELQQSSRFQPHNRFIQAALENASR